MSQPAVRKRHFYHGQDSAKHRNRVSGFLVERLETDEDNKVVARIIPLGMFTENEAQSMMTIEAMKKNLSLDGDWQQRGSTFRCKAVEN
jgi:hypothetical protein